MLQLSFLFEDAKQQQNQSDHKEKGKQDHHHGYARESLTLVYSHLNADEPPEKWSEQEDCDQSPNDKFTFNAFLHC